MSTLFYENLEDLSEFELSNGPVIIVDDDRSQLDIFSACYEIANKENELICYELAQDLLDYLDRVSLNKCPMPSLVFLDINMPEISGFEALEKIREHHLFNEIPSVIIISTSEDKEDIECAKELGANGYFAKALDANEYVDLFSNL